ncbi:MAG: hypothetical protein LBE36_04500 [Flavobacteriaceae bacterium]|jgi:hypothetical protein|nr:hypothetical protein [Flavobacteriaceae bacterium]
MKKPIYLLFFLIFFKGFSQSSQQEMIPEKNAPESIVRNFSNTEISVYQKSSAEKFRQFAEYFNLYQKTPDADLRRQLEQNIFNLFTDSDVEIADFLGDGKNLSLRKFLRKYQNSGISIDVISEKSSAEIGENSWFNEYEIEIGGKKMFLKQNIYFQKTDKKFGNKTKQVWEIKLGEISFDMIRKIQCFG